MPIKDDLEIGKKAEDLLILCLMMADILCIPNPEYNSRKIMQGWDLMAKCDNHDFLIEVKFDKMSTKTGNLAIEYYNPKQAKPSGISATIAHVWAVILHNTEGEKEIWICNTKQLLAYTENTKCFKHISCGGDGNAALKLYKKDSILSDLFVRIDNVNPKELKGIIKDVLAKK